MKALKIITQVVVILVLILAVLGWLIPSTTSMDRSIDINTPAAPIYEILISPKNSQEWSPWFQIDPEGTTYEFEGPHAGEGAKMSWASDNSSVGTGSQTWIKCVHNKSVRTEIYFGGFDAPSYGTFVLDSYDGYTEVTWQYEGDYGSNPFYHYMTLFTEGMLGPQYEQGLKNLKSLVESMHVEEEELDVELEGDALIDSLQSLQQIAE